MSTPVLKLGIHVKGEGWRCLHQITAWFSVGFSN